MQQNIIKYIKIIFLLLIFSQASYAQNSYVRAGYSPKEKSIIVKWFAEKNRFEEGVVIYRKDNVDNNWTKLTDKPFKKADKQSEAESKTSDTVTSIYNFIIYNTPSDQTEYENWEFTLMLQSLLNNDFAKYAGMGFIDNKIEAGKKYSYKVSFLRSGSETELGTSNESGTDDASLTVNNTLNLTQNKEKIFCNWTNEPEKYISYNVYRDSKKLNDQPVYVFETEKKQAYLYADSLAADGTYSYSYTGLDAFGNESSQSSNVSITVVSVSLPPRATNVRFDGNEKLALFWSIKSSDNLKGFNIYRSNDAKGEFTKINSVILSASDTSYVDNTAEQGKKYFYYVSSENNGGMINNSSIIAASSADYSEPNAPENLTAVSDSVKVQLTWNKSTSSNVIGYKVYRNVKGNENEFILLTPLPLKETSYTDTLSKGALNDFNYKVVALNQKYINSEYTQPVTVKLKDVVAPSAPLISGGSFVNNTVVLNWLPQFESDLAGYKIYRSEDSVSGYTEVSSVVNGTNTFTDNSVAANKTYYYKISATDNAGNISQQSDLAMVSTGSEEAPAPDVKFNVTYNKEANSVDVSWENPSMNASQVTGYIVMRREGESEFSYSASEILTAIKFSDTNIEAPAKYSYSIKIIYANGDVVTTPEQSIETN